MVNLDGRENSGLMDDQTIVAAQKTLDESGVFEKHCDAFVLAHPTCEGCRGNRSFDQCVRSGSMHPDCMANM